RAKAKLDADGVCRNRAKPEQEREKGKPYSEAGDNAQDNPHWFDAKAGRGGPRRANDLHAGFRLWGGHADAASFSRPCPRCLTPMETTSDLNLNDASRRKKNR